jgi:hypothetical protein
VFSAVGGNPSHGAVGTLRYAPENSDFVYRFESIVEVEDACERAYDSNESEHESWRQRQGCGSRPNISTARFVWNRVLDRV